VAMHEGTAVKEGCVEVDVHTKWSTYFHMLLPPAERG
jgi:hypothetical protein